MVFCNFFPLPPTATQATLEQKKELPLGIYSVPVMVTDLQGSGTVQTVKVKLCHCSRGVCVPTSYSIGLGPLGILTLLLPLLLLLLLGKLSTFQPILAPLPRIHRHDGSTINYPDHTQCKITKITRITAHSERFPVEETFVRN